MKNKNGITLVALIITITVLIILSFVSISLLSENINIENESVAYHEPYVRFKLLSYEDEFNVYYDVETMVMYAISKTGSVTVLVDREGQPLIWKVIDE